MHGKPSGGQQRGAPVPARSARDPQDLAGDAGSRRGARRSGGFRDELIFAFRPPFRWLSGIGVNLALAVGAIALVAIRRREGKPAPKWLTSTPAPVGGRIGGFDLARGTGGFDVARGTGGFDVVRGTGGFDVARSAVAWPGHALSSAQALAWHARSAAHAAQLHATPGTLRTGLLGVFLVSWLLTDTTTTNQLGMEHVRAGQLRESGRSITDVLVVRNQVLAAIMCVLGVAGAIAGEAIHGTWRLLPLDIVLALAPIGVWMAFGDLVSILYPVRQLGWRERLRKRRTWLRWAIHAAAPYALSSIVVPVAVWPLLALNLVHHNLHRLALDGALAVLVWSGVLWKIGIAISRQAERRRRRKIVRELWPGESVDTLS